MKEKKLKYCKPFLRRFGSVATLTAGRPGSRVDGQSGNNNTGNQGNA